jgi:hypothetical protein
MMGCRRQEVSKQVGSRAREDSRTRCTGTSGERVYLFSRTKIEPKNGYKNIEEVPAATRGAVKRMLHNLGSV